MASELLEMRGIEKTFPGVKALENVDFTLRQGEIHALMGENGAGKSTLIKVLTGVHPPDTGTIRLLGQDVAPRTPREAEEAGISTVFQEVNLLANLSVEENILLGRQPRKWGLIDYGAVRKRAQQALARLGLELEVGRGVAAYSIGIQQMVAIARALDVQAKVLILDEPTSSLDEREVEELFDLLRRLRATGLGIVFVTHFLDQVYQISDRITVLRNGKLVGEYPTHQLPRLELIEKMLGKTAHAPESELKPSAPGTPEGEHPPFLAARGLHRRGALQSVDLEIAQGQVVGLAGLLGAGRTETARLLFGIDKPDSGEIQIEGVPTRIHSPRAAIRKQIAFCSEDRRVEGILPDLSVQDNIILAMQVTRGPLARIKPAEQTAIARHYINALRIKTPDTDTPIRNLSGGNQQKVLLARWLCLQPRLIILDEPTRGIDVGAKVEIERLVGKLRQQGMAILFISAELEEVVRTCDKVVVLRDRHKVGELKGAQIDQNQVMRMIAAHEGS